jgi:hypothetical protein
MQTILPQPPVDHEVVAIANQVQRQQLHDQPGEAGGSAEHSEAG